MINVTINGKQYAADPSSTILEVVRLNDIDQIPTFCDNGQLGHFTSCFICVCEVDGAKGLLPSCATKVREGMVIHTRSEKVLASRKMNLELLLSNHHADCYPPCKLGCPSNVDIQGYIALVSRGLFREAQILMRETNAFPMVCGRVCARPCEDKCRRNHVDDPVDIKNIKRFASDNDIDSDRPYAPECAKDTGKRVAVIGAGPAGLSAAYFLRQQGHAVHVLEKMPEAGGMMRYGIPEYRLPKADLQKEIDIILGLGIGIEYGKEWGVDYSLDDLFKQGYDSVFIGVGAWSGTQMGVPGENLGNVIQGVDFLREVNLGKQVKLSGNVFVVGGGNTAIDAARTAIRCGAREVSIVYRRTEKEMPANWEEIVDAKAEGIKLLLLNNPVEYIGENGVLRSVKLIRMELGPPDASGRRRPVEVKGSEYVVKVDTVIQAIGQAVHIQSADGLELGNGGTIIADLESFQTSRPGVFAGGDVVTGPAIIIGAVANGRKAAYAMNAYMMTGKIEIENRLGFFIRKDDFRKVTDSDYSRKKKLERRHCSKADPAQRVSSFIEVEQGFSAEEVALEAARCMECGCQDLFECKLKRYSAEYGADKKRFMGGDFRGNVYKTGHRFIKMNTSKCINCGQCQRICSEVQKQDVLTFMERGFDTLVVPPDLKPLGETNCISCGLCISVCPVGAITEKLPLGKPGPFKTDVCKTFCPLCGDTCEITLETRNDSFVKLSSKLGDTQLDNLCFRGRFGYERYEHRQILSHDVKEVRSHLISLPAERTLVAISPRLTTDELDLAVKFADLHQYQTYSWELAQDLEKTALLKKNGVSLENKPLSRYLECDELFFFGPIHDELNSVSFRKLVRDDRKKSIYFSHEPKEKYFRYQVMSEMDLLKMLEKHSSGKACVVFNLQNSTTATVEKVAGVLHHNKSLNVLVMNRHINYSYLMSKLPDLERTGGSIRSNGFDTLISFNSDFDLVDRRFKEYILFSTKPEPSVDARYFIPINSIYEKNGIIINQFGERKQVRQAAKPRGPDMKLFLNQ